MSAFKAEAAASTAPGDLNGEEGSRGDRRRARILSAFHDCIIDKGYAKTTLRDVASSAGISATEATVRFATASFLPEVSLTLDYRPEKAGSMRLLEKAS